MLQHLILSDFEIQTLKLCFLGICQLRLDFTTLILNTPPSSGACSDGFTVSSPSLGMEFGTICGQYLSGHHGNSKLLYVLKPLIMRPYAILATFPQC